jgi:hypothetical protein
MLMGNWRLLGIQRERKYAANKKNSMAMGKIKSLDRSGSAELGRNIDELGTGDSISVRKNTIQGIN